MKRFSAIIFFGAMIALPALAGITDDETSFKILLICSRAYDDKENIVYERDKKELNDVSNGFQTDLDKKYSKKDANLLRGKAIVESAGMGIDKSKFDPVEFCRKMLGSLKNQKNQTGVYTSKD